MTVPKIGASIREELAHAPEAKELGEINLDNLTRTTKPAISGPVVVEEGPPPWEADPKWGHDNTDARRFVDVPETWELRWVNPRLLDQFGWRDWQPVLASDKRVRLKVRQLADVSNNIRRGPGGDILAFMPKSWYEKKKVLKAERVARLTQSATARMETFKDEVRRGHYGPHVKGGEGTHPTHTIGDGRTMTDT